MEYTKLGRTGLDVSRAVETAAGGGRRRRASRNSSSRGMEASAINMISLKSSTYQPAQSGMGVSDRRCDGLRILPTLPAKSLRREARLFARVCGPRQALHDAFGNPQERASACWEFSLPAAVSALGGNPLASRKPWTEHRHGTRLRNRQLLVKPWRAECQIRTTGRSDAATTKSIPGGDELWDGQLALPECLLLA